jgi:apolipoprotein N-acyltransferase
MRPSPRTGWLLEILSAVLQILCFPSFGVYFLGWIALVPLFVVLIDRRYSPTLGRCVLLAYVNGVLWYAGTCYWIFHVMHTYGNLAKPVAAGVLVLFCLYLALYHAAFGFLLGALSRCRAFANARVLILAPILWVAVEYARAHITSFPWNLLGYAQVNNLPLTRLATLTGVYGLSFVIALANTILALGFLLPRERRMAVALVGVFGVIALASGVLVSYPQPVPDRTAVLVQQNLPILETDWPAAYYDLTIAGLVQLSANSVPRDAAGHSGSPLIIWPESPAPFITSDPRFQHWLAALAQDSHAYLIVGTVGVTPTDKADKSLLFNSAQLVEPDGAFAGRYDKIHLVPFGEYVPFRNLLAFAESLTHEIGDLSRGNQRSVFRVDGHSIGTFICYESIFPHEVLQFARNGAELFVNISDDAWYGDYGAPGQHLNMARMRAIENGRWLLRATNNGITASISPLGEIVAAAPRNTRVVLQAPYKFESGTTFYTRHGDWFASACAIISLLAFIIAGLSGRVPSWISS